MSMTPAVAALVALLACAGAAGAQPRIALDAPSWRLQSSDKGISIYRANVVGTNVVPFKAVMTIPGTLEEVSMVLEDISRRGEWISHYGMSLLLDRPNDYDQIEYLRVAMPWPVADRSALIRVRITVSDDVHTATIAAESVESHPRDTLPALVRALVYASTFQMTQVDDHVEVASLVFIDPRGRIPAWVVNYFTSRVAQSTLEGLRKQVARNLYAREKLDAMRNRMAGYHVFRETTGTPFATREP